MNMLSLIEVSLFAYTKERATTARPDTCFRDFMRYDLIQKLPQLNHAEQIAKLTLSAAARQTRLPARA